MPVPPLANAKLRSVLKGSSFTVVLRKSAWCGMALFLCGAARRAWRHRAHVDLLSIGQHDIAHLHARRTGTGPLRVDDRSARWHALHGPFGGRLDLRMVGRVGGERRHRARRHRRLAELALGAVSNVMAVAAYVLLRDHAS